MQFSQGHPTDKRFWRRAPYDHEYVLSIDTAVMLSLRWTGLIAAAVAATQLSYRRMMRTATWAQEQILSAVGERKQHLEGHAALGAVGGGGSGR